MTTAKISRVLLTICIFMVIMPSSSGVFAADDGATYLLITNEELAPAFQALVDRRTSQGFLSKLVTVERIRARYSGVDTPEKIRNCVRDHYLNHGTLYVALGGDDTIVPVRYCYYTDVRDDVVPGDLYYADVDGGDWDKDGDRRYGELGDVGEIELTPEAHLGRIPVRTADEATAYIDKVIKYETAPPDAYAGNIILAGGSGDPDLSGTARPPGFQDHEPVAPVEINVTSWYLEYVQPFWQGLPVHRYFSTNSHWDDQRCGDAAWGSLEFANHLNEGYQFLLYFAHADPGRWAMGGGVGSFGWRRAEELTNPFPTIVITGGCSAAGFDLAEPSLCEAFLRNPTGGAVAFFGFTRGGGIGDSRRDLSSELFRNRQTTLGEALTRSMSNLASKHPAAPYRKCMFILLGDPIIHLTPEFEGRHVQIFQPKGFEVIQQGSDLYIRWNAIGRDFGPDDRVKLEYSPDGGLSWEGIPCAEQLPYNDRLFRWEACPLPVGSEYRIRVTSLSYPTVSDASDKNFRIGDLGLLTVRSAHALDVRIEGLYGNDTDYDISVLRGEVVTLKAPQAEDLEFIRWSDGSRNTLSEEPEYIFTFRDDTVVIAEYFYPTRVYYVNDDTPEDGVAAGNDENDGLTLKKPMRHIQAVLERYPDLRCGDVIEISSGIYYENITLHANNTGLELRGAGQEATIIDGCSKGPVFSMDGLSYGVISGLTIQNGSAQDGGGIYCRNSSPTITTCIISDSRASVCGAGLYVIGDCSPTITACIIEDNNADLHGGGMSIDGHSCPKIVDCTFTNNHSGWRGGAIDNRGNSCAEFENCVFVYNSAPSHGGGVHNTSNCKPRFVNCIFTDNTGHGGAICNNINSSPYISSCVFGHNRSTARGGAIKNQGDCSPIIENCLIYENSANRGGGIHNEARCTSMVTNCTFSSNSALRVNGGDGMYIDNTDGTKVENCIFWNNIGKSAPELYVNSTLAISYTDVRGGQAGISLGADAFLTWGEGNIDADPLFADPDNGDYHLKSQAGRWMTIGRFLWKDDNITSPCIDAGDPAIPVGDEPMPNGGRINMGAYGGTSEASKSP